MRIEGVGKPPGCKLLRLQGELEAGRIQSLRIRGDFFASPEEDFEQVEQGLAGIYPEELAPTFDRRIREAGVEVFGISGAGVAAVLFSALKSQEDVP